MDSTLVKEIERLQVQLRLQEDPVDNGASVPPLAIEPEALAKSLRDTCSELLLVRDQAKSLRDSLRRKEEQNELMRKVNEQVQTVQQKLVAQEAELARTHEESQRLTNELRELRGSRATEQGQVEMLQWKVMQREREIEKKDAELKEQELAVERAETGKHLVDAEAEYKLSEFYSTQRRSGLLLSAKILRSWSMFKVAKMASMWFSNMQRSRLERRHREKIKSYKEQFKEQAGLLSTQASAVIERFRKVEADNKTLLVDKEALEDQLREEVQRCEDLKEDLQQSEQELEQLLAQMGA